MHPCRVKSSLGRDPGKTPMILLGYFWFSLCRPSTVSGFFFLQFIFLFSLAVTTTLFPSVLALDFNSTKFVMKCSHTETGGNDPVFQWDSSLAPTGGPVSPLLTNMTSLFSAASAPPCLVESSLGRDSGKTPMILLGLFWFSLCLPPTVSWFFFLQFMSLFCFAIATTFFASVLSLDVNFTEFVIECICAET